MEDLCVRQCEAMLPPSTTRFETPPLSFGIPSSVRCGHMPIHVEVAGNPGQRELYALHLTGQDDLTAQPRVQLQHGGQVQHILLPVNPLFYMS
ncbi:hypothetical protein COCON_G00026320, partial [Conger conger]